MEDIVIHSDHAIIVLVHAHVTIEDALSSIKAVSCDVVSIPCCVNQDTILGVQPNIVFKDLNILSPKRRVLI